METQAKTYWDKWWRENRDRVNKRRRKKYREDDNYRRIMVQRARHQTVVNRLAKRPKPKATLVIHNKQEEPGYLVSEVAVIIDRTRDVLFRWRRGGALPKAIHFDNRKFSLYSASQVRFLQELLALEDLTYEELGMYLKKLWKKTYTDSLMEEIRTEWEEDHGEEEDD